MNDVIETVLNAVLRKIPSKEAAEDFVISELSVANTGFLEVKNFANLSGVKLAADPASMSLNKASLMLMELLVPLGNYQSTIPIRLAVIDQVMNIYGIGKYSKTDERNQIKAFCIERGIEELLHFTTVENLQSVLDLGLNSKSYNGEIFKHHKSNDMNRFDGREHMISLSISYPNDLMFYKYRMAEPNQKWVVLSLPSKILWELECLFCYRNAATKEISSQPDESLSGIDALEKMFTFEGGGPGPEYPSDSQAEVLVMSHIPSDYINNIYVQNIEDVDSRYRSVVTADGFYFNKRSAVV